MDVYGVGKEWSVVREHANTFGNMHRVWQEFFLRQNATSEKKLTWCPELDLTIKQVNTRIGLKMQGMWRMTDIVAQ